MAAASPTSLLVKDQCDKKDEELNRMALEEIIEETKRAKERTQTMGPMGWVKCPLQPTNKRFLQNVLMGTLRNSNRKTRNDFRESHKLTQFDTNAPKRKRSQRSASFSTDKYPAHLSKDRSKEDSTHIKDKQVKNERTSKRKIKTYKKHSPSRKHKLKHKSKHNY